MFLERITWYGFVAHGTGNVAYGNEEVLQASMRLRRIFIGALIVRFVLESHVAKEIEIECRGADRIEMRRWMSMPAMAGCSVTE